MLGKIPSLTANLAEMLKTKAKQSQNGHGLNKEVLLELQTQTLLIFPRKGLKVRLWNL